MSNKEKYTRVTGAESVGKALKFLEGRWKMLILFQLFGGEVVRFSQLERGVRGITQKMLSQQLKQLEKDGLVKRHAYPEVPPRVEYSLTEWGQALCPVLDALLTWANREEGADLLAKRDF